MSARALCSYPEAGRLYSYFHRFHPRSRRSNHILQPYSQFDRSNIETLDMPWLW